MTDKHTPGPWEVGVYRNGVPGIVYCNNALGSAVAVVYGEKLPYSVFSREEEEANARLIASSPRLLSAAKRVTAAFRAIGQPASVAGLLSKLREECEASMLELDEAIKEANGDTP